MNRQKNTNFNQITCHSLLFSDCQVLGIPLMFYGIVIKRIPNTTYSFWQFKVESAISCIIIMYVSHKIEVGSNIMIRPSMIYFMHVMQYELF